MVTATKRAPTHQSCAHAWGKNARGPFAVVACRLHYKPLERLKTLLHTWSLEVYLRPAACLRRT